jgi:hypothetical protein
MFGIDDFALWFGWYFVSDLAQHPATQRLVGKAESSISDTNTGLRVDDPDRLLDWLDKPEDRTGTTAGRTITVPPLPKPSP